LTAFAAIMKCSRRRNAAQCQGRRVNLSVVIRVE